MNLLSTLRKTFLTRSRRAYWSQFGEDALLDILIDPHRTSGVYVDVGAYHPTKFSNTYFLYRRGWRGVNIDVDPEKIRCFELARPGDCNICAAVSDTKGPAHVFQSRKFDLGTRIDTGQAAPPAAAAGCVGTVETRTLNDILAETPYRGAPLDLLNIDTEGHDFRVLCSIDLATYRPQIIVIEIGATTAEGIIGSEIYRYLDARGYHLCGWAHLTLLFRLPRGDVFRR